MTRQQVTGTTQGIHCVALAQAYGKNDTAAQIRNLEKALELDQRSLPVRAGSMSWSNRVPAAIRAEDKACPVTY